jgi:hypothetical protein
LLPQEVVRGNGEQLWRGQRRFELPRWLAIKESGARSAKQRVVQIVVLLAIGSGDDGG